MRKELCEDFKLLYDLLDSSYRYLAKEILFGNIVDAKLTFKMWVVRRKTINMIKIVIETKKKYLEIFDKIKPDAKLFLLMNLYHLFMTAIHFDLFEKKEIAPFPFTRIKKKYFDSFQNDVNLILVNAWNLTDNEEISGYAILNSVDEQWKKLKLNNFET